MLNLVQTCGVIGKIANNIENHGEEEVTGFGMPVTEIALSLDGLKELLDDSVADAVLYTKTKTGDIEPAMKCLQPFVLKDDFEGAVITFQFGDTKPFTLRDCKVKGVVLTPQNGGTTKVSLRLYVRPENDKQILAFLGHQNRECKLDIAEAKVATNAAARKQRDFIADGDDKKAGDDAASETQAAALENSTPVTH